MNRDSAPGQAQGTEPLFASVALIGIGLVGASLAHALRRHHIAGHIRACSRSKATLDKARALGIADFYTTDPCRCVQDATLVVLCTPVGSFGPLARQIGPVLRSGTLVSDVGSTKMSAIRAIGPHMPDDVHFVPGHPIAGTEYSGPEAGFAELFVNRWCILTPQPGTQRHALAKISALWRACGSMVEVMSAQDHDRVLAVVSHLPQLISYTVVETATGMEQDNRSQIVKYSASGFRDFTRLAASDPTMWRDVCLANRDAILRTLERFSAEVTRLARAVETGDSAALFDLFSRSRSIRRQIIEAGQDVEAANFGRETTDGGGPEIHRDTPQ